LNIHQNKEVKSLKEDPLVTWLIKAKLYCKKNTNLLIGVLIAVIIVVGGSIVLKQVKGAAEVKAGEAFGKAMIAYNGQDFEKAIDLFRNVADNYRSTPQGVQSSYMLGAILYGQGKYDEAITWYTIASQGGDKADFLAGQSLESIALCYEAKGDITKAISFLESALKDNSAKFRHNAIKWKLALLTRDSDVSRAKLLCKELVSDTLANEFHQKAENLMAAIEAGTAG